MVGLTIARISLRNMSYVRAFVVLGSLFGSDDRPVHPYNLNYLPLTCFRAEHLVAIDLGFMSFLNGSNFLLTLVVFYYF